MFYNPLWRKYTFIFSRYNCSHFFFEDFREKIDQTVNVFHSRFCRLLKEPKRPVITEGTVPELLGKTPYRGASSNWERSGAPGNAPDSIPKL